MKKKGDWTRACALVIDVSEKSLSILWGNLVLLPLICLVLALLTLRPSNTSLELVRLTQKVSQPVLKTEAFNLTTEMEVGLQIQARSPGASWARKGAEAAAVLISVDGKYNQDLLLWSGDEAFNYRVMLGRLAKGQHTVSVSLNRERSAAGAQQAEIKSLRPLLLASDGTNITKEDVLAMAHSPILYARANTIDRFTDIPLLMYYEILPGAENDVVVRYTVIFTNEDGGTQTAALMSRWGRATDIEWVYQLRAHGTEVVEQTYQGVEHETKRFRGEHTAGDHPLLAVASDNNNFSDLACSAVRFAPLPMRARLEAATRESVMDQYPPMYRVMSEELLREHRISDHPMDVNTIADPREYLYIEAVSEQNAATLGFEVKLAGNGGAFASDHGEPRLRIDRSGYFRTAVRLPKGSSPQAVETITARCYASEKPVAERGCSHCKLVRVLRLDQNYTPRKVSFQAQPESSFQPGQVLVFKIKSP